MVSATNALRSHSVPDQPARQSPEEWLGLAQQGDPEAIAHLLQQRFNRLFPASTLSVQASWKDDCLGILLERNPLPMPDEVMATVRMGIAELGLASTQMIKVYGRCQGQYHPSWYEELSPVSLPAEGGQLGLMDWLSQGMQGSAAIAASPEIAPMAVGWDSNPAMGNAANRSQPAPAITGDRLLRVTLDHQTTVLMPLIAIKEILKVPVTAIMPVPHLPAPVLGIYNYRGTMLWLVDLALQLGLQSVLTDAVLTRDSTFTVMVLQGASQPAGQGSSQLSSQIVGAIVPQVHTIETYDLNHLKPATPDLFSPKLLPVIQGYLAHVSTAVFNTEALLTHIASPTQATVV